MSNIFDALVAERVMGWTHVRSNDVAWFGKPPDHEWTTIDIPAYSSDMNAAWLVVDHLRACGYQVEIRSVFGTFTWECWVTRGLKSTRVRDESVSVAICKAALEFVGGD